MTKLKIYTKTILLNTKMILLGILILMWIVFGIINPEILSLANFYSLLRSALIPLMLALPQMLVIAMGGVDMSFTVITAISSYLSLYFWQIYGDASTPLILILGLAILIGVACYLINWFFIDKVNISPFITTLGVNSLLKGFVLAFISTSYVNVLPDSMKALGTLNITTAVNKDGMESILHASIIFVVLLYIGINYLMERSSFGRQLYAIGADVDFAQRAGINVSKIRLIAFVLAGVICACTGVLHDALSRFSMPTPYDIVGKELNSIAAVIIGIGGSRKASGIVLGTLLGVFLLQTVSTNLIMLGVPAYYQQLASGLIILLGMFLQSFRTEKA